MSRKVTLQLVRIWLFLAVVCFVAVASADDKNYKCSCGWSVWDEGGMNRSGTYEPMVAWSRIENHNYDCLAAQQANYAGVVAQLNATQEKDIRPAKTCSCENCKCCDCKQSKSDFDWLQHDLRDNGLSARMDAAYWENQDPQTTLTRAFAARDRARVKAVEERAVPPLALENGWKRGPLPDNTWDWGAVVLVGQRSNGFYFADFYGKYVLIDIDGKKRRIEPVDVLYYNNSLKAIRRSK